MIMNTIEVLDVADNISEWKAEVSKKCVFSKSIFESNFLTYSNTISLQNVGSDDYPQRPFALFTICLLPRILSGGIHLPINKIWNIPFSRLAAQQG